MSIFFLNQQQSFESTGFNGILPTMTDCRILDKLLNLSEPQFPYLDDCTPFLFRATVS